jgi:hypothetical protein
LTLIVDQLSDARRQELAPVASLLVAADLPQAGD